MKRERKDIYLAITFALLFTLLAHSINSQTLTAINTFFNTLAEKIQNPLFTFFAVIFAYVFDVITLSIISIPLAGYFWMKDKKKLAIVFLIVMFLTALSIYALKQGIDNPRPLNGLMPETSSSFPSGHATISVVFFGLLWTIIKNKTKTMKLILIALPLLIMLSRVYLNVHWFSDIIGGALLGFFILTIRKTMTAQ